MKKTLIATAVAMGITAVSFPAYAAGDNDITTTANEEEEDTGLSLTVIPRLDGSAQTWKNIEKPFGSYSLGNTMLYTILDGNVTDNLSVYACFHLLDKETGWLYHNTFHSDECSWLDMFSLTYSLGNFDLSLGKENIAFGGFEQDDDICTPHLDLCSNSWHTIQSFQWGGRLGYNFEDHGNPQNVFFQIVSSPTSEMPFQDKLFCTTIGWNGNVGNDETMWSLGVMRTGEEDASMKNLWMLTLGDRYTCGNFSWTWDLSFRSFAFSEIFRQECTNIMELRYCFPALDIFARGGCESTGKRRYNYFGDTSLDAAESGWNIYGTIVPNLINSGRDYWFGGLGVEYYPIADRSLRLHLVGAINNYGNDNLLQAGTKGSYAASVTAGLTYYFTVGLLK